MALNSIVVVSILIVLVSSVVSDVHDMCDSSADCGDFQRCLAGHCACHQGFFVFEGQLY